MSVRISVDIPAGTLDLEQRMDLTIVDSGTKQLAAALRDAANMVLRGYGCTERLEIPAPNTAALNRLRNVGG